jgi:hypothetical protein
MGRCDPIKLEHHDFSKKDRAAQWFGNKKKEKVLPVVDSLRTFENSHRAQMARLLRISNQL